MADKQYKFEGSGKTTREADNTLKDSKKDLVAKLKKADASLELQATKTDYHARYSSKKEGSELEEFSVRASEGWVELETKAKTHADLRDYTPRYTVTEFVELTDEQQKALTKKPTTAYSPRAKRLEELDALRD
ncbi:MAG TPA: hypothetical protein VJ438_03685 [Candidatus Nanoarchaeia archaeon]|nr:hypothetical protein [Candidatus Nanoarchaeia archaeon]